MGIAKKTLKTGVKLGVAAGVAVLSKEDIERMLKVGVRLARLTAKEAKIEVDKVLKRSRLEKRALSSRKDILQKRKKRRISFIRCTRRSLGSEFPVIFLYPLV